MNGRKFIEIIRPGGAGGSHSIDALFPVPVPVTVRPVSGEGGRRSVTLGDVC
jgi:hypothetical protein